MVLQGYDAAIREVGVLERTDRGLIVLEGNDRSGWLNNLVTNEVRNLGPGDGNYAFATDRAGRILFDVNILVRDDAIWLDLARDWVEPAMGHLDRYLIMEDVTIHDRSRETTHLGIMGPKSGELAHALGLERLAAMAQLQSVAVSIAGIEAAVVRHDFAGVLGMEIIFCGDTTSSVHDAVRSAGAAPGLTDVSAEALEVLRIEAGIPWIGRDIGEDTLPAETGQFDRSVSFQKGCYLGQEVIERMRSRGSLARQLVGLCFEGVVAPPSGAAVEVEGARVGKVTSTCISPAVDAPIGLGYVNAARAAPGTAIGARSDDGVVSGAVAALPFRAA